MHINIIYLDIVIQYDRAKSGANWSLIDSIAILIFAIAA